VRQVVTGIIGISLLILASASLSGCVEVNVGFEPRDYTLRPSEVPPSGAECALSGLVNRRQNTDAWCWAASSQMVMEYLNNIASPQLPPLPKSLGTENGQCQLVNAIFDTDLRHREINTDLSLSCCKADRITNPHPDNNDPNVTESRNICVQNRWPDDVFNHPDYHHEFTPVPYSDFQFDRYSHHFAIERLTWQKLKDEICQNRPFIFVVQWSGGGRDTSVVGGYRELPNVGESVEVHDHLYTDDDFFVMPYWAFLGVPGDFTHDLDYVNIHR